MKLCNRRTRPVGSRRPAQQGRVAMFYVVMI
jgi:hypothetical protein